MAAQRVGAKAIEDVLYDTQLWQEAGRIARASMLPIFNEIYMGGVVAGVRIARRYGVKDELDDVMEILDPSFTARAAMFILSYTNEWWQGLQASTRRRLLPILMEARELGTSVLDVKKKIEPLFGRERAKRIAVTEITRLFGAGAQAAYSGMGVEMWEWRTAEDGRVCPTCDSAAAGGPYPISMDFVPGHVSCRCWPVPFIEKKKAAA